MKALETVFAYLLNMGLTAGLVILLVLAARLLIRRAPRVFSYVLWAAAAFRLVCPVAVSAPFSVFNQTGIGSTQVPAARAGGGDSSADAPDGNRAGSALRQNNGLNDADGVIQQESGLGGTDGILQQGSGLSGTEGIMEQGSGLSGTDGILQQGNSDGAGRPDSAQNRGLSHLTVMGGVLELTRGDSSDLESIRILNREFRSITAFALYYAAAFIWIAGLLLLLGYTLVSWIKIRRKVASSVRFQGNVYECDNIRSPFVFGLARPRIYIPFRLPEKQRELILAHERCHIRRGDFLVRPLAWLLVCVYWFQPLVWVAYVFMSRDMEQSCDEKVAEGLEETERKEYGKALYSFAVNRRIPDAAVLAFGEGGTKMRVKRVLECRKCPLWEKMILAAICLCLIMVCTTNALASEEETETGETITETGSTETENIPLVSGTETDEAENGQVTLQILEKGMDEMLSSYVYPGVDETYIYTVTESTRTVGFIFETYVKGELVRNELYFGSSPVETEGPRPMLVQMKMAPENNWNLEGKIQLFRKQDNADDAAENDSGIDGYKEGCRLSSTNITWLSEESVKDLNAVSWGAAGRNWGNGEVTFALEEPEILAAWILTEDSDPGYDAQIPGQISENPVTVIMKIVFSEKDMEGLRAWYDDCGEELAVRPDMNLSGDWWSCLYGGEEGVAETQSADPASETDTEDDTEESPADDTDSDSHNTESAAIIGGTDGPTSIFIAGKTDSEETGADADDTGSDAHNSESAVIIGGADGPTSIFIAGKADSAEELTDDWTALAGDTQAVSEALYSIKEASSGWSDPEIGLLVGQMYAYGLLPQGDLTFRPSRETEEDGVTAIPCVLELELEYRELPEDTESFYQQMDWASCILLALMDDLETVVWTFPDDGNLVHVSCDVQWADQWAEIENIRDTVRDFGSSAEAMEELLKLREKAVGEDGDSLYIGEQNRESESETEVDTETETGTEAETDTEALE